ncbi:MAG: hypothetical protein QM708_13515 [Propioniciclava sp.]|uniref:hypothetical protein n=1 Tax=Propioniciclava sp. TaxID=2038686 RepID=UPI0039E265E3
MALNKAYANVELQDGRTYTDLRVTFTDRKRWEVAAKARGWDAERQPVTLAAFLSWAAMVRLGHFTGTFDDFVNQLVDAQLDATAAQEDRADDPSQTGA